MRVAPGGGTAVQDHVALAEIELCGELIIAASAAGEERLSLESIDQVLRVGEEQVEEAARERAGERERDRAGRGERGSGGSGAQ
ncbi:hypothetical protein [Streptomyces sp. 3214.6]|uniref:hypothetical protein n=1 Tax=Streptomyces sp. 3214.6 TaxID=1882757 RepID=UPI00090C9A3F|nr:hypothetical protein [Streptomyces sp. 3214.6]SHI17154.1 hypothetical protein SAMN05444521_4782 [Streptomyces sp. 3214.6]